MDQHPEVTTPKRYVARAGFQLSQKDVDIIGPYLHESLFPDGKFDKERAIADASRPESPLHKYFDWNDATAAHSYRLNQAQRLFTCFYCVTPDGYEYPSVVSLRIEDGQEYVSADRAMGSPDLCQQVLQQAVDGLFAWQKRYEMFARLPEFQGIIREIRLLTPRKQKEQKKWQEAKVSQSKVKTKSKDKSTKERQGATVCPILKKRKTPKSQKDELSQSQSSL